MSIALKLIKGSWFRKQHPDEEKICEEKNKSNGIIVKDNIVLYNKNNPLQIGRDIESSDIVLDDETVSRKHAVLFKKENNWHIIDNKSKNGTLIIRESKIYAVKSNREPIIINKDRIVLGRLTELEVIDGAGFDLGQIIRKNLEKMNGNKDGDMQPLLITESIGGNAGKYNNIPCAGVNFYYDNSDGSIVYFGNVQDVPKKIRENYKRGTFTVAVDLKFNKEKIVGIILESSGLVKSILENTIKAYNEQHK